MGMFHRYYKIILIVLFANLYYLSAFSEGTYLSKGDIQIGSESTRSGIMLQNPSLAGIAAKNMDNTNLTIEGQDYVNTETGLWWGVEIKGDVPKTLIFRNNSITSVNSHNYMLLAGDEEPKSSNNNLDGAVITGNKITWNGTTDDGLEGCQLGYNINQLVAFNYFDKPPYAVVFKSGNTTGNMTNVSGGFAYNIVKNSYIGVRIKGINGTQIYNNTFYDDIHNGFPGFIYSTTNQTNGNMPSTGTKIKNNIFYLKYNGTFIHIEAGDESGFECDYNVYYCEGGSPNFVYKGATKTWAQWQALGYDTHSAMINPNFINTTEFVPTSRLNYGTNLGVAWQSGLSNDAVWTVNSTPAKTNQTESWQVGARIDGVTGISQLDNTKMGIHIFPNPVKDQINISNNGEAKKMSVKLYDIKGTELYYSNEKGDCKLDISAYQPGIYFLKVISDGQTNTRKIIKD